MKVKFKYFIFLGVIGLALVIYLNIYGSSIFTNISDNFNNESLVVSKDKLTINYKSGETVEYLNNFVNEFSISNASEEEIVYNISLVNNISASEGKYATISLSINGSVIYSENTLLDSMNVIASNILIDAGKTDLIKITIALDEELNIDGKVHINTDVNEVKVVSTFADTIISSNMLKEAGTLIGSEIASLDEGLIKESTSLGDTYYFRGDSLTNYVNFAGFDWRIVRITEDMGIKLVLDQELSSLNSVFCSTNIYSSYTECDVSTKLNTWYNGNLNDYDSYLKSFNISYNGTVNSNGNYSGGNRLKVDNEASYDADVSTVSSKIGLLSADEVVFAGGTVNNSNKSYYLYNDSNTYDIATSTLSHRDYLGITHYFVVDEGLGNLETKAGGLFVNLRPVVVLNETVSYSGNGTMSDPYIIK